MKPLLVFSLLLVAMLPTSQGKLKLTFKLARFFNLFPCAGGQFFIA